MSQQPLAYLYPEFLESPEARPIRILSEYLEPLRRALPAASARSWRCGRCARAA